MPPEGFDYIFYYNWIHTSMHMEADTKLKLKIHTSIKTTIPDLNEAIHKLEILNYNTQKSLYEIDLIHGTMKLWRDNIK